MKHSFTQQNKSKECSLSLTHQNLIFDFMGSSTPQSDLSKKARFELDSTQIRESVSIVNDKHKSA
jgi:hypothetical protein